LECPVSNELIGHPFCGRKKQAVSHQLKSFDQACASNGVFSLSVSGYRIYLSLFIGDQKWQNLFIQKIQ
jgi:hypothetical protein